MANEQREATAVDLVKTASIDDVFLALRSPYLGTRIEVTDVEGRTFSLVVQSLSHEDGSGRSLVIKGHFVLISGSKSKITWIGTDRYEAWLNFKGGARRGWIKIFN